MLDDILHAVTLAFLVKGFAMTLFGNASQYTEKDVFIFYAGFVSDSVDIRSTL
jgi:hypothetical protein